MKIYCASSWRNPYYSSVIAELVDSGFAVWDWRNPPTGGSGFKWQDAGADNYQHGDKVSLAEWYKMLQHPVAQTGFASDLSGMNWCDVGVLLHPCGKSAHLEAGWIAGRGKTVHVLCPEPVEPDLMVLALNGGFFRSAADLVKFLKGGQP